MNKLKRTAEAALDNRARQVALSLALAFASYVLFTQFIHAFFG